MAHCASGRKPSAGPSGGGLITAMPAACNGQCSCGLLQDPVQPDLRVGDALLVVGSSSLPEADSEELALSLA